MYLFKKAMNLISATLQRFLFVVLLFQVIKRTVFISLDSLLNVNLWLKILKHPTSCSSALVQ